MTSMDDIRSVIVTARRANSAVAELTVLSVLLPGGQLTAHQLSNEAHLSLWAVRGAITRLERRGLIVPSYRRARWRITERGSAMAIAKRKRHI
ncbi:hypothetical protein IU500_27090 [Nocardia terpenica]|nr:hypothetical protein [Nocardia terpenica]MBF6064084.1 hypothetical protein [Nocardia terpenica]MBF6107680.1 hypothetical protein [Nocardia terpenica]MBF6114748.1 hypothetical protein [Nocardia terpenica]MBF6121265.1 hypothetical protein [Nocardia terpenica]MBF6153193.1 hypothetical protein [Nocardia terpenica]